MKTYMEHINMTVVNMDKSINFLQLAFPEFEIRGGGSGPNGNWAHIGTPHYYVALTERSEANSSQSYNHAGFNHVGFVVEDVQALADRLLKAGYERSYPVQNQQFRIRDYFVDAEGNEFEFVEYLTEKAEERNDYSD